MRLTPSIDHYPPKYTSSDTLHKLTLCLKTLPISVAYLLVLLSFHEVIIEATTHKYI